MTQVYTPWNLQFAPENTPSQKEIRTPTIHFLRTCSFQGKQPTIFIKQNIHQVSSVRDPSQSRSKAMKKGAPGCLEYIYDALCGDFYKPWNKDPASIQPVERKVGSFFRFSSCFFRPKELSQPFCRHTWWSYAAVDLLTFNASTGMLVAGVSLFFCGGPKDH